MKQGQAVRLSLTRKGLILENIELAAKGLAVHAVANTRPARQLRNLQQHAGGEIDGLNHVGIDVHVEGGLETENNNKRQSGGGVS